MSKVIKTGFLGAGDIADLHAAAVRACPQAELTGIFDTDGEKAASKARQYGCRSFNSCAEMLAAPEIDAVFVLTPLEEHHDGAVLALEAGKHVLVEKPTAVNIDQIKNMQRVASVAGKVCMPVHNYLYEDSVTRTRELLESGKLGELVAIYVLYNIHHPEHVAERYPGVVRQILTHHSYITLHLGGPPKRVMAMASTINDGSVDKENLAMAMLELEGGALAHLQASFAADDHTADNWTFAIKVVGTAGATRFSHADWVQNVPAAVHSHTYSAYHYSIGNTARFFIEQCLIAGDDPLSNLEDAINCQRIIEAIEDSMESGRGICLQGQD